MVDTTLALKTWLPFCAAVLVALISAGVAVYQARRNAAAQRLLELEKMATAERSSELAEERAEQARIRQEVTQSRRDQMLPFLDALNDTLVASYSAAYMAPYLPRLGVDVPQLRLYADREMSPWLDAYSELSRRRMQLFLALEGESIELVVDRLLEMQDRMDSILAVRQNLWSQQATTGDLWQAHRDYLISGFALLLEVQALASSKPQESGPPASGADRQSLAARLVGPLERSSSAVVEYGLRDEYAWIAFWELDVRPEMLAFLESRNQGTYEEFVSSLSDLTTLFSRDPDCIEVQLVRLGGDDALTHVFCLSAKFASRADLGLFVTHGLPRCRKAYPRLWSSWHQPREIHFGESSDPGATV